MRVPPSLRPTPVTALRHYGAAPSAPTVTTRMPVYYDPKYTVALPAGHRFPMERYAATADLLAATLGAHPRLRAALAPAREATDAELRAAHTPAYVEAYTRGTLPEAEHRRIGFPWSPAFVERTRLITGGTLQACAAALQSFGGPAAPPPAGPGPGGVACNAAGGTHHAFADHGEGFCIFNDLAIAARVWGRALGGRRVLVVDVDVHQGNGTAAIFSGDASVVTLSVHGARNWPWASRVASTLDVDVADGAGDDEYAGALAGALARVEAALRPGADAWGGAGTPAPAGGVALAPCLGVGLLLLQAGADPLAEDRLGRLRLTRSGLRERNETVLRWAERHGWPVAVTMGGGYSRPIELSARAHVDVFLQAAASWARREAAYHAARAG